VASIRTTTGPTWPARSSPGTAARVAGFALAVLAIELVLAHGVAQPEVARYVLLFVGLFFVALIFRFPLATTIVFFGLTDFIFPSSYFSHNVGALTVKPHEVALACLFALALAAPKRRSWGGTTGAALAVFLGLMTLSALIGVEAGRVGLTDAFNVARPMGLLAMFYVIVRLFPEPEDRRTLLIAVAVMAALAGVAAVLISFGAGFGSALEGSDVNTITEGLGSIQRVRLVGLAAGPGSACSSCSPGSSPTSPSASTATCGWAWRSGRS
jgi:hypothetical protein